MGHKKEYRLCCAISLKRKHNFYFTVAPWGSELVYSYPTLKLWRVDPSMRMDRCPTLHPLASMVCKSLLQHTTSNRSKEGFHGTLI